MHRNPEQYILGSKGNLGRNVSMNKDLTVGKPETVLWKFCMPLFGSILFQQLYNIADSLVAGKFIGEPALAAVGNSYEITLIFIAFSFGCNIGCSVIVSQLFGARRLTDMKTAVCTAMITSAALCVILTSFGLLCSGWLLRLIHTPAAILADCELYLDIYIWGFPFLLFYNIATGIFSALGDSRTPFFFLAFSSIANILADIWFVTSFEKGVAGVAWATFLCQGVSCLLAVTTVFRRLAGIPADGKVCPYSLPMLRKIAVIAVPSILQQSFISIGNIILQGAINDCSVGVTAGYSAAIKLNNLVTTSFTTLGNGISNYTAQNIGAGNLPRVREGFRAGVKMVWILCVPITAVYLLAARPLVAFFIKSPTDLALASGTRFLYITAPFYCVISVKLAADGVLRGAGLMKKFMAATFTDLLLRVVLAETLAPVAGYSGIWCAWPIGWTLGMVLSVFFYRNGPWRISSR